MNNVELKDYLSEKIDANHQHVLTLLANIQKATDKTNGRVTVLEDEIWDLVKKESAHVLNCPQKARIDELEKENLEQRMIKKYPKTSLGILVFVVIFALFGTYKGYLSVSNTLNSIKMQQQIILNEKQSLLKK